jgi:hypothetical protein
MWGTAPTQWIEDAEARRMALFAAEANSFSTGIAAGRDGAKGSDRQLLDAIWSRAAAFGAFWVCGKSTKILESDGEHFRGGIQWTQ